MIAHRHQGHRCGNRGMTGAKRFLLGSVPNKVSHHAPCSVLIIRTI
ncbi:MAG TPA: universal stress protein [Solirubrobacteraceae bacterium]|nr:universal stress protein [Solirubrobacteraceae bacterium]